MRVELSSISMTKAGQGIASLQMISQEAVKMRCCSRTLTLRSLSKTDIGRTEGPISARTMTGLIA